MPELFVVPIAFSIGFISGFIGTNVGGGGLINIPSLIFLGAAPQVAIATDQVAMFVQGLIGTREFHKAGKLDFKLASGLALLAAAGTFFGVQLLIQTPRELIERLLAIVILAVALLVLKKRDLGTESLEPASPAALRAGYFAFFVVGVWGGFFGAGFAVIAIYLLLFVFRKTFLECAAIAKLVGVGVGCVSLPMFIWHGYINWALAIPLALGSGTGAYFGTHWGVRCGDRALRALFLLIVTASALKLLFF